MHMCSYTGYIIFLIVKIVAVGVQILYSGDGHWVCTSYSETTGVCIYDSYPQDKLPSDLEVQIAKIYGQIGKDSDGILISRVGVQKQIAASDCGAFALAFAYHVAREDNLEELRFDQRSMRYHLVKCFGEEKLSPFPQTDSPVLKSSFNTLFLRLYCCRMPECYDNMVCCDMCESWFHFTCVGIQCVCKNSLSCACAPSMWHCSTCAEL